MTFIGEIRAMPYQFIPSIETRWLVCDGTEYQVQHYQVLYSIIGTTYGGTTNRTFKVPDLRIRIAVGAGTSPRTAKTRTMGQTWGDLDVALTVNEAPVHNHKLHTPFTGKAADYDDAPAPAYWLSRTLNQYNYGTGASFSMHPETLAPAGGGAGGVAAPHENRQPVTAIPYFICHTGIYPQKP